ncbi:hypothetical protein DEJ03_08015 [Curtobacterium sp. MCLR17_043]|uniref:hypothetical protein n=1 Tax=Curtobacterium sp. MCLR17_043 TaxID=2175627 RepID=UPI000D87A270|nr:hypothetical protein [Curtobacterium sp. MCLR17_043]PYY46418.1 hypothetical protein DEJ03_08015 [Curtobacterium sp. MCLR17_043]
MSYFAILQDQGHNPARYTIQECHINLWCLATLPPRRRAFYLDVGLRIEAGSESLHSVGLSLPVAADAYADLSPYVKEQKSSELIFDSPVDVAGDTITVDGKSMRAISLRGGLKPDERLTGADLTVWKLEFNEPLAANQLGYLRVRFRVTNPGRIWHWQPRTARHSGAILDFRVNDQRSAAFLEHGDELRSRTLPMATTYLFVMTPAWLHGRTVYPALRYARVLETTHWHRYLDRKSEYNARQLVVSYWRSQNGAPLRVYIDYVMGRRAHPWWTAFGAILVLTLLLGTVFQLPLQPATAHVIAFIQAKLVAPLLAISGTALLGWAATALRHVPRLGKLFGVVRRVYRKLDEWRYGKGHISR